jgi:hypothetical protein
VSKIADHSIHTILCKYPLQIIVTNSYPFNFKIEIIQLTDFVEINTSVYMHDYNSCIKVPNGVDGLFSYFKRAMTVTFLSYFYFSSKYYYLGH